MTRTSAELYDMGERNGGRPAGEGTKTPCSTLEKFKSVKSAQVAVKWGPMLMRQRTMLDLGGARGVSYENYGGVRNILTSRALSNVPTFRHKNELRQMTNSRIFTIIIFLIALNMVIWLSNNIDPITGQQLKGKINYER